jgi:flagellar biosynthesis/type III secretory pathway M-ring protein FliF/YscJ
MEFLTRGWTQIRVFLSQMTPTTRWLIGCVVIILAMMLFITLHYAGQAEMVPISPFASERQPEVVELLKARRIDVQMVGGQIMVPHEQYFEAISVLQQSDLLKADTSSAFDAMIARQTPWQTNQQSTQAMILAKQKVLSQIIAKMKGVHSADVMISRPESTGFGKTYVRPSASVNVVMRSGSLNNRMVQAIAGLVSGAEAEMQPQDVVVIDANLGRQFTVKDADDVMPGETLEHLHTLEQYHRDKIMEVLGYIPGVIVAVNVRTDSILRKETQTYEYLKDQPLKSTYEKETEQQNVRESGEAGARPNTGLDIAGGGSTGTMQRTTENRSEFIEKPLTVSSRVREAGQTTKQINATVNVPRAYFVSLYLQSQAGQKPANAGGGNNAPTGPTDQDLDPVMQRELRKIEAQIMPLIKTAESDGVIAANMIPDATVLTAMLGERVNATDSVFMGPWVKPAGLLLLGLVPLVMMMAMVRKATQKPSLPTVEELAGVPPTLPTEDDLIGEADEDQAGMAGMEVDDKEIQSRRIAEQIADMIKGNPRDAATIFQRWVRKDEY